MRSKVPYFFLGLAAVLAAAALVLMIFRPGALRRNPEKPAAVPTGEPAGALIPPVTLPEPEPIASLAEPMPVETPEQALKDLGLGLAVVDPADLVNRISEALEAGDFAAAGKLIGKDAFDPAVLAQLQALAAARPLKLRQPHGVREVGEVELNALARWALELDGQEAGRDRIFLDLRRIDGRWSVEKLTLPPGEGEPIPRAMRADALGTADAFVQAVLRQDFEFARDFVDSTTVSDAKIAALCIIFEEGQYRMRAAKPLRAIFRRESLAGFLANVETAGAAGVAQFAINLRQPSAEANWIVSEINLDQLLGDYARRVAGGDVYYSPLVKNPAGGDTLALYFEFDEDQVNPRTRRQLEIVAQILKTDPTKKITLSGHTDALGTEDYNHSLSARRAAVVRDFLAQAGVAAGQIVLIAKGASQPRRPNFTETGDDDPQGRRANRRTEIYLDF